MKLPILLSLLTGCSFCLSQKVEEPPPYVMTQFGAIEGYWKTSYGGKRYRAFEGIPYAQAPVGEYRFRIAKRISPWRETLVANKFGPICLQYIFNLGKDPPVFVLGSEDCLLINIYTPITEDAVTSYPDDSTKLLPVILFIHGGSFQFGAGSYYGPKYLLDHNVIFFTFNYRLGPLGFLSTEDDIVPGNLGLKDQVEAMRWVKENIRHFGGNPSSVTLAGQSAGAASVHYHMLSKLSAGLFQRGLLLSGNALLCWAQTENSLEKAKKLATIVDCPSDNVKLMVECLRNRPADQITNATGNFMSFPNYPVTTFGPVVEKGGEKYPFIDQSPIDVITSGKVPQDVPLLMGTVSEEGVAMMAAFVLMPEEFERLNDDWDAYLPQLLDFNDTIPEREHHKIARSIRKHYLGSLPVSKSTLNLSADMVTDRMFHYDIDKAARLQARANLSPVLFYYFSYRGAHSLTDLYSKNSENFGVAHGDDLSYVLDSSFDPTTTENDRRMQKILIEIWVSYATYGTPKVGVEWNKVDGFDMNELRFLHIAGPDKMGMNSSSNFGDKNFWLSLPLDENIRRRN